MILKATLHGAVGYAARMLEDNWIRGLRRVEQKGALMKHSVMFLLVLGLAVAAAQEPETIAWRNGAWFDGTGFRRVAVYSIGDRLTLKNPQRSIAR